MYTGNVVIQVLQYCWSSLGFFCQTASFFIDILPGWGYMLFIDILPDGKKTTTCISMTSYLAAYLLIALCKLCMEVFARRNFLRAKNMREHFWIRTIASSWIFLASLSNTCSRLSFRNTCWKESDWVRQQLT